MAETEQLRKVTAVRAGYKATITKRFAEIDTITNPNVDPSHELLKFTGEIDKFHEFKVNKLESYKNGLIKLYEQVSYLSHQREELITNSTELNEADLSAHIEGANEFEMNFSEKMNIIDKFIKPPNVSPKPDSSPRRSSVHSESSISSQIRLPEIKLPNFDGNPEDWVSFWEAFNARINQHPDLDEITKFTYLRGLLNGNAFQLIKFIPLTSLGYAQVIEILKSRYDKKPNLKRKYLQDIFNCLERPKANNSFHVRKLYDNLIVEKTKLDSISIPPETYEQAVIIKLVPILPDFLQNKIIHERDPNLQFIFNTIEMYVEAETTKQSYQSGISHNNQFSKNNFRKPSHTQNTEKINSTLVNNSKPLRQPKCRFCEGEHFDTSCNFTLEQRKQVAMQKKLCYNCLSRSHLVQECQSTRGCRYCGNKHHTALCNRGRSGSNNDIPNTSEQTMCINNALNPSASEFHAAETTPPAQVVTTLNNSNSNFVYLQTATGLIVNENTGSKVVARVLLDSGSTRSYITESLAQHLELKTVNTELVEVNAFGSVHGKKMEVSIVNFKLCGPRFSKIISASTTPVICSPVINNRLNRDQISSLSEFQLADRDILREQELVVDILIGADFYWDIITGNIRECGVGPLLLESRLGWVLSGKTYSFHKHKQVHMHLISQRSLPEHVTNLALSKQVQELWDTENIGIKLDEKDYSSLLDDFEEDLTFLPEEKRFQVKLLFKKNVFQPIHDNYNLALQRLRNLLNKMKGDADTRSMYQEVLEEQLKDDVIEEITSPVTAEQSWTSPTEVSQPSPASSAEQTSPLICYLPHRPVLKHESTTTKLRVVYDGSACERNQLSLNQHLHPGPSLLTALVAILIRFRLFAIVMSADISRAYHQLLLHEDHRDLTRFLWRKDGNPSNPLQTFRSKRLPFGLASSAFILIATLRYFILQAENLPMNFATKLTDSLYVDDLIFGVNSIAEGTEAYFRINQIMDKISMKMNKWASNSPEINEVFSKSNVSECEVKKILGIVWDTKADSINVNFTKFKNVIKPYFKHSNCNEVNCDKKCVEIDEKKIRIPTKREILSLNAIVFDPLGLYTPFFLPLKLLFQKMCINNLGWDEILPNENLDLWNNWLNSIEYVLQVNIPRQLNYLPDNKGNVSQALIGFSDASKDTYAAVIYLVVSVNGSPVKVSFVICKSRIAPLKQLSIPKLELLGATLLARLMKTVEGYLSNFNLQPSSYFTDSKTVLFWIKGEGKVWNGFVSNRLSEIHEMSSPKQWNYVPTAHNPGDIPTRCAFGQTLLDNLNAWYSLNLSIFDHVESESKFHLSDTCLSNESNTVVETNLINLTDKQSCLSNILNINTFNSLPKVVSVLSKVLKFVKILKKENFNEASLFQLAKNMIIRSEQSQFFNSEIHLLQNKDKLSKSNSLINNLRLFLDDQGIIRCRSRINAAQNIEYDFKHPILLPAKGHLINIIIAFEHNRLGHAGLQQTLCAVRSSFWVPKSRRMVKSYIGKCLKCLKVQNKPYPAAPHADLPSFRLSEEDAFSHCGIDYCGPFYVKLPYRNTFDKFGKPLANNRKCYILLITCAVTRAVQLELTSGMDSDSFIMALRRFFSVRGISHTVYSDNFSTFKTVQQDVKQLLKLQQLRDYFSSNQITWKNSLEKAPWWNGFSERLIASLKRHLKKIIGKAILNYEEFLTCIKEVEAILNSRPLSYNFNDLDSLEPITPSLLINGKNLTQLPHVDRKFIIENDANVFVSKRLKYLESVKSQFWESWRKDYLSMLTERHFSQKTNKDVRQPKIGDICLLKEDKVPRLKWKTVIITNIFYGRSDNHIRSVEVKVNAGKNFKTSIFRRPPQHLIPLEINGQRGDDL